MISAKKIIKHLNETKMNEDVIVDRNGKLYIETGWETSYNEPVEYKSYWPTGISANDYNFLIGKEVKHLGSGMYSIFGSTSPSKIELEQGGQTKPGFTETRPIKKPKNAVSWKSGKWVNY
jgi:kynurenine formamidase